MAEENKKGYAGSPAWQDEYARYLGEHWDPEFERYSRDIAYDLEKFQDPVIVGAMIHRLVQERQRTNALYEAILTEMKAIRALLEGQSHSPPQKPMPITSEVLGEADSMILSLVKARGRVTADDVQREMGYRGRNAASARLNRLYQMGLLEKIRAGRKVYYSIRGHA